MRAERESSFFKKIGEAFKRRREDSADSGGRQEKQEVNKNGQVILEVKKIVGPSNERDSIEQAGGTVQEVSKYLSDVSDAREISDERVKTETVAEILNLYTFKLEIPNRSLACEFTVKVVSEFVPGGEKKVGYHLVCEKRHSSLFQRYIDSP